MAIIIVAFMVCSGLMAFETIDVSWTIALSIFGSSLLSVFAGSGLRGSLYFEVGHIIGGLVMASLFMGGAQWLGTMYSVGFFGNQLTGHMWSLVGFVIGFLCTSKNFAVEKEVDGEA